ncbi:MAG: diguanylate cyclase [Terriglobia bacterium]|jgi:diguanylate cyclase (GGDEF)-like protein
MKILVAEDDLVTGRMLQTYLVKWGYEVQIVTDGLQAWRILQQENAPRLALLDWMMPEMDGMSICREVRRLNIQPYIYLILLTARRYQEDVVAGLEAGADEYLTKPFDPYELRARLRAGARIVELQDSLIQAREELRELAMHDPLTHLLNRRAIMDILMAELSRAAREQKPLTVMMVDIDHFKSVNDKFGHPAGDSVLSEVSRRLRGSTRGYDNVGRFGGEEFLVVAPGCDAASGLAQAERLRAVVSSQPITVKDISINATVSVGVATSHELTAQHMETLLSAADKALYRAKENGRNRVEGESSTVLLSATLGPPVGALPE